VFTLGAVLALAIGANASVFAIVQRVVLNPLPYPDSDRVIKLEHRVPRMTRHPSTPCLWESISSTSIARARFRLWVRTKGTS